MARPPRIRTPAIAYLRTSLDRHVPTIRTLYKRQRDAIADYAKHAGFAFVDTYYDADFCGAYPIENRPGFLALLDRIEGDGVRTVLIEDASRFARELITQELGILSLIKRGVRVLTAAGDDLTATDDPFNKATRATSPELTLRVSASARELPQRKSVHLPIFASSDGVHNTSVVALVLRAEPFAKGETPH